MKQLIKTYRLFLAEWLLGRVLWIMPTGREKVIMATQIQIYFKEVFGRKDLKPQV